jgi:hypothetical protein
VETQGRHRGGRGGAGGHGWPGGPPPGETLVRGRVGKAQPIEKPDTRAFLELEFSKLVDTSGKEAKIEATVVSVDNAREKVEQGRITGILASETLSARIGQGVDKLEQKSPKFGGFLGAIKQAVLKEPAPDHPT